MFKATRDKFQSLSSRSLVSLLLFYFLGACLAFKNKIRNKGQRCKDNSQHNCAPKYYFFQTSAGVVELAVSAENSGQARRSFLQKNGDNKQDRDNYLSY